MEFQMVKEAETTPAQTPRQLIKAYLNDKGIKHSLSGYDYLILAGGMCLAEKSARNRMGEIYAMVAAEFGVSPGSVERCMRNAIQSAGGVHITNSEFLARMADDLEDVVGVPSWATKRSITI